MRERGPLSVEFCDYDTHDARKAGSDIPRAVRDNITPAVESVLPLQRGPKAARLAGPFTLNSEAGRGDGPGARASGPL